jgi:hypothetical protein
MNRFLAVSFAHSFVTALEYATSTHFMFANRALDASAYLHKDVVGQIGAVGTMLMFSKKIDDSRHTRAVLGASQLMYQASLAIDTLLPTMADNAFTSAIMLGACLKTVSWGIHGAMSIRAVHRIVSASEEHGSLYLKMSSVNCIGTACGMLVGTTFADLLVAHPTATFACTGVVRYALARKLFIGSF